MVTNQKAFPRGTALIPCTSRVLTFRVRGAREHSANNPERYALCGHPFWPHEEIVTRAGDVVGELHRETERTTVGILEQVWRVFGHPHGLIEKCTACELEDGLKYATLCAHCGLLILVGDGVVLVQAPQPLHHIWKPHILPTQGYWESLTTVCCVRETCLARLTQRVGREATYRSGKWHERFSISLTPSVLLTPPVEL